VTAALGRTHPAWCDVDECDATGVQLHYSRALPVPATAGAGRDSVGFTLVVYGPSRGQPLLDVVILPAAPGPVSPVFDVDADQLARLRAALDAVAAVLDADLPHLASLPHPHDPEGGVTT
jgi:hypothetical protein